MVTWGSPILGNLHIWKLIILTHLIRYSYDEGGRTRHDIGTIGQQEYQWLRFNIRGCNGTCINQLINNIIYQSRICMSNIVKLYPATEARSAWRATHGPWLDLCIMACHLDVSGPDLGYPNLENQPWLTSSNSRCHVARPSFQPLDPLRLATSWGRGGGRSFELKDLRPAGLPSRWHGWLKMLPSMTDMAMEAMTHFIDDLWEMPWSWPPLWYYKVGPIWPHSQSLLHLDVQLVQGWMNIKNACIYMFFQTIPTLTNVHG